jgi:predicted DsbA family dithiol-disulfide isomerase
MTYNSGLAHELSKWVETQDKGDEYHNAVFRTFFVDGRNIGSASVLVNLAKDIGLSGKEAEDIIKTRSFKDAVAADWSRSLKIDPEYIPSLMIGEKLLVNPQQYELFEQFMIENNVRKQSTVSPST